MHTRFQRSSNILTAMATTVDRLLAGREWPVVLPEVLEALGRAADLSRIVVFQHSAGPGSDSSISQIAEWATTDLPDRRSDPTIQGLPMAASGFGRWVEHFERGVVVAGNVRDFPPDERRTLERHRIRSVAAVPIPGESTWWGFLSFDDCRTERRWSREEIAALQAAANVIGSAVRRQASEAREEALGRQVRQLQKLEAIGLLAGGVAHDFNNVLTAITGYCELLASIALPEDASGWVDEIARASHRAAGLTRQLLTFSRQQIMQPTVFDVNETVGELQKMLRRLIGEHIGLVIAKADTPCLVFADPGQLEQVVVNLGVNARDAMEHGGTLAIEVRRACAAERPPGWTPSGPEHVLIVVSDTGVGMTAHVKAHLFEPFFTTKPVGRGTGLGLSTVYGIVHQAQGAITVDSEPERGTTFRIHLPMASSEAHAHVEPTTTVVGGHETVLLVEDESVVRNLTSRILRRLGYVVLEAEDGSSALRLAAAHEGGIDLLLTDIVMPGASGREVAQQVTALHGAVRVLYMSGYTDGEISHDGTLEPGSLFLQKPFTCDTLARMVRDALR